MAPDPADTEQQRTSREKEPEPGPDPREQKGGSTEKKKKNRFIEDLIAAGAAQPQPTSPAPSTGRTARVTPSDAIRLAELYTFTGFLWPEDLPHPPGGTAKDWRLLYLDLGFQHWLLVEKNGIALTDTVEDKRAPDELRDMLLVRADTAVGIGNGAPSLEARFLVGKFTRAADFRTSVAGGTLAAATGVYCEAESIGCCRPTNRPG